jgi:predicted RNase H-like nuclease
VSQAVGVDGYPRGWVAVAIADGAAELALCPSFADVLDAFPAAVAYGVDIPLGVGDEFPRAADRAARAFLGRRASSVFLTPPSPVLTAHDYADANRRMRRLTGSGLSRQSYALARKILEVEPVARGDERVFEVHPEVSFAALTGAHLPSKHTWNGFHARRSALAAAGIALGEDLPAAPLVDVVDAAVAAWSARRYAERRAEPLPAGREERLGTIWY